MKKNWVLLFAFLWATYSVAQKTQYKEYSYTQFFKLIENEKDSVFKLQDALIKYNPNIYPIELLVSQLEDNPNNLKGIDTSWMSDKNSKIYIGYFRMAKYFESSNSIRIFLMKQFGKQL